MNAPMLGITIPDIAPPTRCMDSFIFTIPLTIDFYID
jgi:hypothetical protein